VASVLADTHAALWYLREPGRLSPDAILTFQQTVAQGQTIFVSSISLVEVCYLIERARLPAAAMDEFVAVLVAADTPFVLAPLDFNVARAVERIPRGAVPEMPDRIIAATALHLGVPLVTRDLQIRSAGIPTIW
jgi:PIN domain nuclease of toxin-antitoxin system